MELSFEIPIHEITAEYLDLNSNRGGLVAPGGCLRIYFNFRGVSKFSVRGGVGLQFFRGGLQIFTGSPIFQGGLQFFRGVSKIFFLFFKFFFFFFSNLFFPKISSGMHPPRGSMRGWYASYWNAFLFEVCFEHFFLR